MPDERDLIRNFHTAVQRYVIERMSSFDAYLKPESGGVWSITAKMDDSNTFMEVFPRIHFLNSLRWDIGRISLETLKTLDQLRTLLDTVAQSCLAFTLGGKPAENGEDAVRQEYQAFFSFMSSLSPEMLVSVKPLPFWRALQNQEHSSRLSEFGQRWSVEVTGGWFERNYYPVVPRPVSHAHQLAMEAFDAEALVGASGTQIVQRILSERGIQRIYIFEDSYPGVECEVSHLDLARAIPRIVGFIFSDSLDWMIYTSWHSTVTIGGDWLLKGTMDAWPDWEKHVYEYFDLSNFD